MNFYTPKNHVGTYSHHIMKNHATQLNPTAGKISTRGQQSFNMKIPTRGKCPLTVHTSVATQPMEGGKSQPSFTRNPPQSWDHPKEVSSVKHIREGHRILTHKEESQIPIFLDYILDNLS
jgi:hypothetical protein